MLQNFHCNFLFNNNVSIVPCTDEGCVENETPLFDAKYLTIKFTDFGDNQVFLDCYPSYITNTSTDISVVNGFTHGEIILSIFGFLIFVIILYKTIWDWVNSYKFKK